MGAEEDTDTSSETKTDGAVKAGDGEYLFDFDELEQLDAGPGYSTGTGGVIEGERIQVGLIHKPRGTGSRLHKHPNEQFNYVLQGTLRVKVGDQEEQIAGPGAVIYLPADVPHRTIATPEEDVLFYVVKDLTHGIIGNPVDDSSSEPHYDPGFEPDS